MKKFYCDASFDWKHTESTEEKIVRGKIAVADMLKLEKVDKVAVGKVEGLKQYINVLELTAVARAVELASLENPKEESIGIYSDSKTAVAWANAGKIKGGSVAHENALEYLRKARIQFGGIVTFHFVPRDLNPAGILLELELEKEKPHAI